MGEDYKKNYELGMRRANDMGVEFFPHAEERRKERKISKNLIEEAILHPDEIISRGKTMIVHKRYFNSCKKKEYLLRIFLEEKDGKKVIVSLYRTSKISKYFRG